MEGTFLQSIGVLVGAPSRRIYVQSSISFLQHYLLVVTKITTIIKVGGVDCKPGARHTSELYPFCVYLHKGGGDHPHRRRVQSCDRGQDF